MAHDSRVGQPWCCECSIWAKLELPRNASDFACSLYEDLRTLGWGVGTQPAKKLLILQRTSIILSHTVVNFISRVNEAVIVGFGFIQLVLGKEYEAWIVVLGTERAIS